LPRSVPDRQALKVCKIVSHRGEHDNKRVMENTLPAFAAAREAGVWGVECDIRWTRDLVPVICHDVDCKRVFGNPVIVRDVSFSELRDMLPQVPTLQEVVDQFGHNTHLMLELKNESFPDHERQKAILQQILAGLEPVADFHILALDPRLFGMVDFLSSQACLPVAETNIGQLSRVSLDSDYGGITGHYLLIRKSMHQRHRDVGQLVGTGFPASRRCLFRELNRGVEWVFSNRAVSLQKTVDTYLAATAPEPD